MLDRLISKQLTNKDVALLNCSSRQFETEDIEELVQQLNQKPHITEINFDNCNINDERAEALSKLKYVQSINFNRNNIGSDGFKALCNNRAIKSLNFCHNSLEDNIFPFLKELRRSDLRLFLKDGNMYLSSEVKNSIVNEYGSVEVKEPLMNRLHAIQVQCSQHKQQVAMEAKFHSSSSKATEPRDEGAFYVEKIRAIIALVQDGSHDLTFQHQKFLCLEFAESLFSHLSNSSQETVRKELFSAYKNCVEQAANDTITIKYFKNLVRLLLPVKDLCDLENIAEKTVESYPTSKNSPVSPAHQLATDVLALLKDLTELEPIKNTLENPSSNVFSTLSFDSKKSSVVTNSNPTLPPLKTITYNK